MYLHLEHSPSGYMCLFYIYKFANVHLTGFQSKWQLFSGAASGNLRGWRISNCCSWFICRWWFSRSTGNSGSIYTTYIQYNKHAYQHHIFFDMWHPVVLFSNSMHKVHDSLNTTKFYFVEKKYMFWQFWKTYWGKMYKQLRNEPATHQGTYK